MYLFFYLFLYLLYNCLTFKLIAMKLISETIKYIDKVAHKAEVIQYSNGKRVERLFRIGKYGVSKIPSQVSTMS